MTDRVKTPSIEALIGMKTEEGITIARKRATGKCPTTNSPRSCQTTGTTPDP